MISDLFMEQGDSYRINLPDADLCLYPGFIETMQADKYLQQLQEQISWSQQRIKVYGREYAVPRLSAWYADNGLAYEYSGLRSEGLPWIGVLIELKNRVEQTTRHRFNSVLANLYRDGADSVGWHADDESELGDEPVIASLSFGEQRNFQLKHRHNPSLKKTIPLAHGSLLLMQGATQQYWLHQIPKSVRQMKARINLTFRWVE